MAIDLADPDHPDPDRARSDVVLGHAGNNWVELGAGDDATAPATATTP